MSQLLVQRSSRRQFIRGLGVCIALPLVAACAPASPTAAPPAAPTVAPAAPAATGQPPAATTPASGAKGGPTLDDFAAAAAPFKGKTINIMMSAGPWGKSHEKMLADFNKATGMDVRFDSIPEAQISAKLQTSVMSRSGDYDGAVMVWDWVGQYRKAGLLADLAPYISDPKMPPFNIDEYPGRIVQFLRRDGKIYGVPVSVAAQIMMYRKDLFASAGIQPPAPTDVVTWQQVSDWAKKLTTNGVYGVVHPWGSAGIYADTMNVLPGDLPILDKDKKLSIYRDPRVAQAYDLWKRMYDDGLMSKEVFSYQTPDAWAKFQAGQAAIAPTSWPAAIGDIEDTQKSAVAGKVGYCVTPGGTPRIGGWACQVLSDSKEPAATYLFLNWLANTQNTVNEVLKNSNYDDSYTANFQTNVATYKSEILKGPAGQGEFDGMVAGWNGAKSGRLVDPDVPEFAQLGNEMYPFMAKIITGELSSKEGLDKAAAAGEKILADAGYYK